MARIIIDGREILGTTGRYIRKLLEYLQEIDNQNEYLVLLHQDGYDETILNSQNFHKTLVDEGKFSLSEQIKLPRTIKALRPDIVHFTMPNQPLFLDVLRVTTVHDLTPVRLRSLPGNSIIYRLRSLVFAQLIKKVVRSSSRVLTGTQYAKDDIADFTGVKLDKIILISEAADEIPGQSTQIDELVDEKFVFYAGRAQPHKNLETLIKSFEILNNSLPELKLVLAGKKEYYYEELEKFVAKSPARQNIVFTGFVSDAELKWLYQNAEAYVFPSLSEGFGLPGLEAMVHGCPVVSSNATCLPEVYGEAAIYFDPTNPEDMAEKIETVLQDKKLRQALIEKGHTQAAKYSWRRMAEQTLSVYQEVLAEGA